MYKLQHYRWLAVLLGFVLAACNQNANPVSTGETNTPPGVAAQLFEGFYAADTEVSSFVTCAMGELPGSGKGYWLVPNDEFSRLYENPTGITMGDIAGTYGPSDVFAIYVRFEGILSAEPGKEYGTSGLYIGEIQVTKVLEASRHWVGSTDPQRQVFTGCGNMEISTPTPIKAPTVTAGISIQGHVRLNGSDGPGLANVQIYAKGGYGSTEGPVRLLATTDEDGYYWNGNAIPLMVIWAELDGYVFDPKSQEYMGPGQSCTNSCDFIAHPAK